MELISWWENIQESKTVITNLWPIKSHPCFPQPNFQNFLFTFWCWLYRSAITTADRTHLFSVFKRFDVQISFLPHLWFLWEPSSSIWTIPKPYHPHPGSSEHVWPHITLWSNVLWNEVCQEYTAFTTGKSSLVWYVLSVTNYI